MDLKLEKKELKEKQVTVRVTNKEFEILSSLAKDNDTNISCLIRHFVLKEVM